jgi:hypothetical protein
METLVQSHLVEEQVLKRNSRLKTYLLSLLSKNGFEN